MEWNALGIPTVFDDGVNTLVAFTLAELPDLIWSVVLFDGFFSLKFEERDKDSAEKSLDEWFARCFWLTSDIARLFTLLI